MEPDDFSLKSLFTPFTTLKAIHYIILVGLLVFGNVLINGFVWDDKTYILNNLAVHSINIIDAFKGSMFNQGGQYRPIPALYFSILYSLFKEAPFFYHFSQISLHIINAILVFLLFKQFFKIHLAFFLSLVFLVHPLQVESVAYIGATGNNLFFLFGMSALLLATKLQKKSKSEFLIFGLLLLALLSKETGGIFLGIVLLYRWLYRRKRFAFYAILSSITLIIYLAIRFFIGNVYFAKSDLVAIARLSFGERLLQIPSVIFYYLKTFFYPHNLAIAQEWIIKQISMQSFYLPLFLEVIFLLLILFFISYLFRTDKERCKVAVFFFSWLFAGLFLHAQIFPLDWTVADRWFYFSIVGMLGIIGVLLQEIKLTWKVNRVWFLIAAGIIISALSIRTIVRNTNWVDAITLYIHDSKVVDSWDIENNLGYEYKTTDNQSEALKHYVKAIELFPFESTYLNAAVVHSNMGNHDKAIEYYYKTLAAKKYPTSAHKHNLNTYSNTINALLIKNRTDEAKKIAEAGIIDYPDAPELWAELAIIQQWMGDDQKALTSASKAKELQSTQFTNYIYEKVSQKQKIQIYPGKNEVKIL